jgi:hypothetical protein
MTSRAPWSEWGRERKPINAAALAGLLRQYRIGSKNVSIGDEQKKGYYRGDLVDTWLRYVPDSSQASQRPNGGETPSQPRDGNENEESSHARPSTQESLWDGPGTGSDSDTRPRADKGKHHGWDGGTAGTGGIRGEPTTNGHSPQCRICGEQLRPHLQARGTCGPCQFKAGNAA